MKSNQKVFKIPYFRLQVQLLYSLLNDFHRQNSRPNLHECFAMRFQEAEWKKTKAILNVHLQVFQNGIPWKKSRITIKGGGGDIIGIWCYLTIHKAPDPVRASIFKVLGFTSFRPCIVHQFANLRETQQRKTSSTKYEIFCLYGVSQMHLGVHALVS